MSIRSFGGFRTLRSVSTMKKPEIDCNQFQAFSWWRQSAGCEIHQMNGYSLIAKMYMLVYYFENLPVLLN